MPPKNNSTLINPSEISTMMHEEEEFKNDISILRDQVQPISLSQKLTKNEMEAKIDGLKKGMEAKMDGLKNGMEDTEAKIDGIEEKMKDNMEDLKNDLNANMEGLTKLIQ